jgi:hypothetical protein
VFSKELTDSLPQVAASSHAECTIPAQANSTCPPAKTSIVNQIAASAEPAA